MQGKREREYKNKQEGKRGKERDEEKEKWKRHFSLKRLQERRDMYRVGKWRRERKVNNLIQKQINMSKIKILKILIFYYIKFIIK